MSITRDILMDTSGELRKMEARIAEAVSEGVAKCVSTYQTLNNRLTLANLIAERVHKENPSSNRRISSVALFQELRTVTRNDLEKVVNEVLNRELAKVDK